VRKVNWGIIGLGNIAQKFMEGFIGVENSNLLAIASNSNSKIAKFKKQFNIKNEFVFSNYEDLLDCKEIDIIYISIPNSLHYEWIVKCAEKNKKTLVEKPATLNLDEANKIKKIFDKKKLFFSEGFMYRYDPKLSKVVELIKGNEIGRLLSMESSFGVNILTKKKFFFFKKKKKINENNRLFNKKMGGGCILDLGCYPTSFSLLIASLMNNSDYKNFKINNLRKEMGETNVDIHSEAEIIFNNNFKANVNASFKKDLGNNTIIKGEKGYIIINNTFLGIKNIKIVLKNKSYQIKSEINENLYSKEIYNVSQSILSGANEALYPGMQLEETVLNMKILDYWKNEKK